MAAKDLKLTQLTHLLHFLAVEDGTFDAATTKALNDMGHNLQARPSWGFMNVVTWDRKANKLDAASDPRRPSGLGKVQ